MLVADLTIDEELAEGLCIMAITAMIAKVTSAPAINAFFFVDEDEEFDPEYSSLLSEF